MSNNFDKEFYDSIKEESVPNFESTIVAFGGKEYKVQFRSNYIIKKFNNTNDRLYNTTDGLSNIKIDSSVYINIDDAKISNIDCRLVFAHTFPGCYNGDKTYYSVHLNEFWIDEIYHGALYVDNILEKNNIKFIDLKKDIIDAFIEACPDKKIKRFCNEIINNTTEIEESDFYIKDANNEIENNIIKTANETTNEFVIDGINCKIKITTDIILDSLNIGNHKTIIIGGPIFIIGDDGANNWFRRRFFSRININVAEKEITELSIYDCTSYSNIDSKYCLNMLAANGVVFYDIKNEILDILCNEVDYYLKRSDIKLLNAKNKDEAKIKLKDILHESYIKYISNNSLYYIKDAICEDNEIIKTAELLHKTIDGIDGKINLEISAGNGLYTTKHFNSNKVSLIIDFSIIISDNNNFEQKFLSFVNIDTSTNEIIDFRIYDPENFVDIWSEYWLNILKDNKIVFYDIKNEILQILFNEINYNIYDNIVLLLDVTNEEEAKIKLKNIFHEAYAKYNNANSSYYIKDAAMQNRINKLEKFAYECIKDACANGNEEHAECCYDFCKYCLCDLCIESREIDVIETEEYLPEFTAYLPCPSGQAQINFGKSIVKYIRKKNDGRSSFFSCYKSTLIIDELKYEIRDLELIYNYDYEDGSMNIRSIFLPNGVTKAVPHHNLNSIHKGNALVVYKLFLENYGLFLYNPETDLHEAFAKYCNNKTAKKIFEDCEQAKSLYDSCVKDDIINEEKEKYIEPGTYYLKENASVDDDKNIIKTAGDRHTVIIDGIDCKIKIITYINEVNPVTSRNDSEDSCLEIEADVYVISESYGLLTDNVKLIANIVLDVVNKQIVYFELRDRNYNTDIRTIVKKLNDYYNITFYDIKDDILKILLTEVTIVPAFYIRKYLLNIEEGRLSDLDYGEQKLKEILQEAYSKYSGGDSQYYVKDASSENRISILEKLADNIDDERKYEHDLCSYFSSEHQGCYNNGIAFCKLCDCERCEHKYWGVKEYSLETKFERVTKIPYLKSEIMCIDGNYIKIIFKNVLIIFKPYQRYFRILIDAIELYNKNNSDEYARIQYLDYAPFTNDETIERMQLKIGSFAIHTSNGGRKTSGGANSIGGNVLAIPFVQQHLKDIGINLMDPANDILETFINSSNNPIAKAIYEIGVNEAMNKSENDFYVKNASSYDKDIYFDHETCKHEFCPENYCNFCQCDACVEAADELPSNIQTIPDFTCSIKDYSGNKLNLQFSGCEFSVEEIGGWFAADDVLIENELGNMCHVRLIDGLYDASENRSGKLTAILVSPMASEQRFHRAINTGNILLDKTVQKEMLENKIELANPEVDLFKAFAENCGRPEVLELFNKIMQCKTKQSLN